MKKILAVNNSVFKAQILSFETNVVFFGSTRADNLDWVNIIYIAILHHQPLAVVQALVSLKTWMLPFSLSSKAGNL